MRRNTELHPSKWIRAGVALGVVTYGAYVVTTWATYGRRRRRNAHGIDELMDRFMPEFEVSDRHSRHIEAPSDVTFDAACTSELGRSPIVQAIFKTREAVFGAPAKEIAAKGGLVEEVKAFGW